MYAAHSYEREHERQRERMQCLLDRTLTCDSCGEEFPTIEAHEDGWGQVFCSPSCSDDWQESARADLLEA